MSSEMAVLPLPFMTFVLAVMAAILISRQSLGADQARFFFAGFFVMVAGASLLIGLRFGYGLDQLVALQRVLPLFIGPLLYLGFASLATEEEKVPKLAALHLGIALAFTVLPPLFGGAAIMADWLIALSYLVYATLLWRVWRRGPNELIRARLENAGRITRWSGVAAGFLGVVFLFDTVIAVFFASDRRTDAVALISTGAVLMAVLLAFVIFVMASGSERPRASTGPLRRPSHDPARILDAAEDLMLREALFVDTGLTADRLARRLHVPTRALSEAINQYRGVSVSQYVNSFRLRRAADLLATTDQDLSAVMTQSGFLTRSNFYREFQREHGQSPIAFRKSRKESAVDPGALDLTRRPKSENLGAAKVDT